MLGALIGDIVGSVYEWHNHKSKDFPLFQPDCRMTDDSVMTAAVASAVLMGTEDLAQFQANVVAEMRRLASTADTYLCSANAILPDGRIVNIDGFGNRLAATLHGTGKVYMIVGKNKLAENLDAAIARIKNVSCPANAKRLKLHTPCALTGVCNQAECGDDCMCRVTAVLERPPRGREITVIFTEEALGY